MKLISWLVCLQGSAKSHLVVILVVVLDRRPANFAQSPLLLPVSFSPASTPRSHVASKLFSHSSGPALATPAPTRSTSTQTPDLPVRQQAGDPQTSLPPLPPLRLPACHYSHLALTLMAQLAYLLSHLHTTKVTLRLLNKTCRFDSLYSLCSEDPPL